MCGFFTTKENSNRAAGTLAIGCGGGGCNIVNRLGRMSAVHIITVNTDRRGLVRSRSNKRILLGSGAMDEGCAGNVSLGGSLTRAASAVIEESIEGYLNAAIMVGLGGGTGTASAEIIAGMAKRNGSRVITFASLPMSFEAARRKTATDSINAIKEKSDILVLIDADRLVALDPMLGAREAFSVLDQMMCESFMTMMEILEGNEGEKMFQSMKGKTFTVSFAEGMKAEKVASSLVNGMMTSSAVTSEPVIFIRGNIPHDGSRDKISETVEEATGKPPVFIQGQDGHGMNLVMFIPVQ